jgi:hypothetical protein
MLINIIYVSRDSDSSMEIHEVVSFLFQRADATLTFWNFYIAVSTAILAFLAAAKAEWLNKFICVALTIGFALFAVGNLWALSQVCDQREALIALISQQEGYDQSIATVVESTHPPDVIVLVPFHIFLDIAMITLIWTIVLFRRKRLLMANKTLKADSA